MIDFMNKFSVKIRLIFLVGLSVLFLGATVAASFYITHSTTGAVRQSEELSQATITFFAALSNMERFNTSLKDEDYRRVTDGFKKSASMFEALGDRYSHLAQNVRQADEYFRQASDIRKKIAAQDAFLRVEYDNLMSAITKTANDIDGTISTLMAEGMVSTTTLDSAKSMVLTLALEWMQVLDAKNILLRKGNGDEWLKEKKKHDENIKRIFKNLSAVVRFVQDFDLKPIVTRLDTFSKKANPSFDTIYKLWARQSAIAPKLEKLAVDTASEAAQIKHESSQALFSLMAQGEKALTIIALLAVAILVAISLVISSSIGMSLGTMVQRMKDLATGDADLTQRIAVDKARNELDHLAIYINQFIERIQKLIAAINRQAEVVREQSESILNASDHMENVAVKSNEQASVVHSSLETTAENANSIVNSIEELNLSVNEIASNTTQASQLARQATDESHSAIDVISVLQNASAKIGEMSSLIGSISEQTNLLALNATIEAARAGEAGKGFAVVAGEVKELAKQTGDSVTKIEEIVAEIQRQASNTMNAMENISEVITREAELADSIAAAIEEQTATTSEVTGNTQAITGQITESSSLMDNIKVASKETAESAANVRANAGKLFELSEELSGMLGQFRV